MEKRVRFRSTWLPWVLLAPQLAVIGVFFFWPAAQALLQSVQIQDAFGATREFVGWKTFAGCLPTRHTSIRSRPPHFSRYWLPASVSRSPWC